MVTPDAQRTMNTYLGACVELTPKDADAEQIAGADIIYIEGYLWDTENMKASVLAAMHHAENADTRIALTLSDSFCVDRFPG